VAVHQILQPLPYSLRRTGLGREVEEMLICFGILHDGSGLAIDRQDDGPPGLAEVPNDCGKRS